jgi:hypothetical protein
MKKQARADKYEQENQAMLEHYGLEEVTVVRNLKGEVVSAAGVDLDGESFLIHHSSPRSILGQAVHVSSSTRSGPTRGPGASAAPTIPS